MPDQLIADVFNSDVFSATSLVAAYIKAKPQPTQIGDMGLFTSNGIFTRTVMVEEQEGQLTLIPDTAPGSPGDALGRQSRKAFSFVARHYQRETAVYASELIGVRAFGLANSLESLATVIAQRLAILRRQHDTTLEFQRMGAIVGKIYQADGVTLLVDLHAGFGVSQITENLVLTDANFDIRGAATKIRRDIQGLGVTYAGLHAFCSPTFIDAFVQHPYVKAALQYQEGRKNLADMARDGIPVANIMWQEYEKGLVGGVNFIPDGEAYVVPTGAMVESGPLFQTSFAPSDMIADQGTIGQPIYVKPFMDPSGLDKFIGIHTQANPISLCVRPDAVIRITRS